MQRGRLGDFLVQRRSQLRPDDVGLRDHGDRRRVVGLRREELAQLAGVSPSYYARLEQGQSLGASVEVLDALARALCLSDDERDHLFDLARSARARPTTRRPPVEHASHAVREVLRAMDGVPALVTGRRTDVLAWNPLGHALLAGHLDPTAPQRPADRPNTARLVFLDAHTRELHADWPHKARAVVEHLRLVVGKHPDDPLLSSLIGELVTRSPDFAKLWASHRVRACDVAVRDLHHPLVGALTTSQQSLRLVDAPDQLLITFTCEPGSPSGAALALLRQLTATAAPAAARVAAPTRAAR